jgi:hypothetical protein
MRACFAIEPWDRDLSYQIDSSIGLLSCSKVRIALVVLRGRWFQ